jgi:hypothetical protein
MVDAAQVPAASPALTETGMIIGSAPYMSLDRRTALPGDVVREGRRRGPERPISPRFRAPPEPAKVDRRLVRKGLVPRPRGTFPVRPRHGRRLRRARQSLRRGRVADGLGSPRPPRRHPRRPRAEARCRPGPPRRHRRPRPARGETRYRPGLSRRHRRPRPARAEAPCLPGPPRRR